MNSHRRDTDRDARGAEPERADPPAEHDQHEGEGDWRQRPHDHLVEPFFGGLRVEPLKAEGSGQPGASRGPAPIAWWALGGLGVLLVWWLSV